MAQIKPVSALKNYQAILSRVKKGKPIFLNQDGQLKYALVNINEYDEFITALDLLKRLKNAAALEHYDFDAIKKDLFD
ncbi:type II toxin-antitoxin system prevent-host-death family antitoxin [Lactobacillus kefiranofaciens]|uniref:type II toxin-antitoxin system prevent-host-death family antitoxin n=1 Tax=Lactobacillus kefiranofaciens TaxID=267818 RepID=UPI001FBADBAB|nr:type II toxin-antitoxin system prevent-host-death family antitoxin [Lactobacillus kefiranofaciens]MCJ2172423.1 type II toxin-antitoxin system prevent-host-death family antitoxin [Lactobacillus kefiranofaciens]